MFRGQFAALPGAVREYEIQEFAFFGWGLTLELDVRTLRQFHQLDAFLNVGPARGLVRRHVAHDGRLRRARLTCLGVEEVVADPAIQLVHVHRVDAVLEAAVFTFKLGDGIVVELAFITVALAERMAHPHQRLRAERDPLQQAGELSPQHFLARVRLRALSLVAGAVVVDIPTLLDLAHHGAAAMPARDQPAEREQLFRLARPPGSATVQNRLHALPEFAGYDGLVAAAVGRAVEIEVARVNAVPEDLVDGGFRRGPPLFR